MDVNLARAQDPAVWVDAQHAFAWKTLFFSRPLACDRGANLRPLASSCRRRLQKLMVTAGVPLVVWLAEMTAAVVCVLLA